MMLKTIGFAFFMLLVQSAFALDDSDCKCQAPKVDSTSGSNVPVYPWIVSLSKRPETPWAMFPQLFERKNNCLPN